MIEENDLFLAANKPHLNYYIPPLFIFFTSVFMDIHNGIPDIIYNIMQPNDHTSKTHGRPLYWSNSCNFY